ncbi:hypothetical protein [Paenibacillus sp. JDR-2]|uniref:hypothetical protein n=1 Tax=Paenibacillus sp. (strain JDR-2) TaxID=324057 RepID=UPI000166A500|nr:hypothetical protein [Paenibacillus sp. JDR-2]ACT00239.1 hypothetical protein Pjdr2_1567 [Paenibacillus sp. JDR-2]
MAKKINKVPVCFNMLDPDQAKMHEWVCSRPNRSGYLKRLIQRDMEGGSAVASSYHPAAAVGDDEFNASSFI